MLSKHCARTDAALGGFPWFIDHCGIAPWDSTSRCHKLLTSTDKLTMHQEGDATAGGKLTLHQEGDKTADDASHVAKTADGDGNADRAQHDPVVVMAGMWRGLFGGHIEEDQQVTLAVRVIADCNELPIVLVSNSCSSPHSQ